MSGRFIVVGEIAADGSLARISTEVATLARALSAASEREAVGIVVGADPDRAAAELAKYLPRVVAVTEPLAAEHAVAVPVAERVAAVVDADEPSHLLIGASPDGRDVAGILSVRLGWGVLINAIEASWGPEGLQVGSAILGGSVLAASSLTADRGIVTVRQNVVTAVPSGSDGSVEAASVDAPLTLPIVPVGDRVAEVGDEIPIEEARIIVAGGRGVGGPEGFGLVRELAAELGGAVGASRAAVDSGWIPFAQQIGQTGKIVKPSLYLALGISGAIQHKVGMQTSETIVAVNRDPDAPIAEFADLVVIGDLFAVGPALLAELRARKV
jgi:electron transfer flavoprotein alpha subunit